jgi:NAD(P)-dependent dehydrogenase (short-subunit alcohol dehydrogenase family)
MTSATPDFGGRRAVVTGAGSGIGKATALLLLERGASVLAVDLTEDALRDVADAGGEALAADLTRTDARARVLERAGETHHLVNSAGVIRLVPILEVTEDDWNAVVDVNAKALFFMCQAFGRVLPDDGSIVNLSSVSARDARTTETAVYASSKAAVISLTRSFAHALSPRGVRVNCVLPGITDTPMQDKVLDEVAQLRGIPRETLEDVRLRYVPMGRTAPPREIAEAIVWLLSPSASYVNGQALGVDGGYTMI